MEYEMPTHQVYPDAYTFTELMTISRNFEISIGLFQMMCEKKISPNDRVYRVISGLAGNDENKQNIFKELWQNQKRN